MFRPFICVPTVMHKHSLWAGPTVRGGDSGIFGKSAGFPGQGVLLFAVAAGFTGRRPVFSRATDGGAEKASASSGGGSGFSGRVADGGADVRGWRRAGPGHVHATGCVVRLRFSAVGPTGRSPTRGGCSRRSTALPADRLAVLASGHPESAPWKAELGGWRSLLGRGLPHGRRRRRRHRRPAGKPVSPSSGCRRRPSHLPWRCGPCP
jgi:hypothetical protein